MEALWGGLSLGLTLAPRLFRLLVYLGPPGLLRRQEAGVVRVFWVLQSTPYLQETIALGTGSVAFGGCSGRVALASGLFVCRPWTGRLSPWPRLGVPLGKPLPVCRGGIRA